METAFNQETGQTAVLDPKVNKWFVADQVAENADGQKAYLYNNEWHINDIKEAKKVPETLPGDVINQTILNTLSSLGGFIGGGIAGAGRMVFSRGSIQERLEKGNLTQEKVTKFISDLPEIITGKEMTPETQEVMEVIGWPFEKLHEGAGWLGEKAETLTGLPYLEPTVSTVAEALPLIFGPKFLKKKLVDVPLAKGKTALSAKAIEKTIPAEKATPITFTAETKPVKGGLTGETGAVGLQPKEKPQFTKDAQKVEEMYDRADKASNELHKKSFSKIYKKLKTELVDVSGNLKTELLKQGDYGKEVVMRHDLIAGASTKALNEFQVASDKIFKGLDKTEHEYLNRFIQSRRTIAIEDYKQIKHPEGLGATEHQAYLNQFPKDMWDKLNERANAYFGEMRGQLKQLRKENIISQESYDALIKSGDYSPRQFLQHIDPEITYEIGGKKITVPDSGIKSLDEGSYGLLEKDASLLLSQVVSRTQGRIFRNRANKALYNFAKVMPDNGVVSLAKVIKITEDGKPIYQKAQAGYEKIKVMIDGQAKEMVMPSEMANEWILRDPILTAEQAAVLRWVSGTAILKPMATGLNPEFALTNFPRDLAHVWLTDYSKLYSSHLPVYLGQMAKDIVTVAKDAATKKGRFADFINEGGGMEFLTHQGRITTTLEGFANDVQKVMGWLGETSEIITRLALRERAIRKGLSPTEATWRARDYLDFSQGGSFTKAADTVIPYLNAGIQGTRGLFKAGAMAPGLFSYKVAQVGTLATSLYYMNRFMNTEAWEQISVREKNNNFIVTTPFSYTDKEGNKKYIYFKIAKDQGQRLFCSIFEALAGKAIGDEVDSDQIIQSIQDSIPIIPTETLPPLMDAFLGYTSNKDFWRNEDIWKGPKVEPEEEWTRYTHPLFVRAGGLTGLSPERLKYGLQQFFTYGNIWSSLGGYAWQQIFKDLPDEDKNKTTEEIILKQPFVRRLINSTDPYYKYDKKNEDAKIKASTEQYKLTREFDLLSQRYYDGEASRAEVMRFIHDAPLVDRKRLQYRHINRGKIQGLSEKRWWLELSEMSPETRAIVYWNRWRVAGDDERQMLDKNMRKVPGIISARFYRQLSILKKKQ